MAGVLSGLGGLSLSGMASEMACCCTSAAFSLCCCSRCPTFKNSTVTRVVYAVILFLATCAAWVMLYPEVGKDLDNMAKYTGQVNGCGDDGDQSERSCDRKWGMLGVYRVMFGCTLFYALLAAILVRVTSSADKRAGIQNGFWGIKLVLLVGLCVAAFFIPNAFFHDYWGYIGIVGAFIFLLVQLVLLVDFAHALADSWVGQMEEGSTFHKYLIVGSCGGMYVVWVAVTVLLYVFYTKSHSAGEQCHENKFFISANLLLGMLCTAVAISDTVQQYNPNSGLLQSGIVVSYITYLTWSAVSNNIQACQPTSLEANDNATTIIGAMITFIAVAYSSLRTSSASQLGSLGMGDSSESTALLNADADADDDELEGDDDGGESGGAKKGRKQHVVDDEGDAVLYNWSFFHLTFAFASLYLMMVLTDWAVIRDGTQPDFHVGRGSASVWVKVVSSWISAALYIWSLIAPACLPDRDFS